jgi:hypothetical protein
MPSFNLNDICICIGSSNSKFILIKFEVFIERSKTELKIIFGYNLLFINLFAILIDSCFPFSVNGILVQPINLS